MKQKKREDMFHLDDDVTEDYLKGKDGGLVLEDRYKREKKWEGKCECMVFVYISYDLTNDRVWIIVCVECSHKKKKNVQIKTFY